MTTTSYQLPGKAPATSRRSRGWYAGWGVMTLLALAIAAYAGLLLVRPATRPPFIAESPYPLAVLLHFAGAGGALALGAWQFLSGPRAAWRGVHRWVGRAYALGVVIGGVSGLVLATQAQEGLVSELGFGTLAVVWLGSLGVAVRHARAGDIGRHRDWMTRNFALTYAAVTLRFYIPASVIGGIAFETAYPVIAWLCWVPNLAVAEWIVRRGPAADA